MIEGRRTWHPLRVGFAGLLLSLVACDPGWGYTVPEGMAVEEDGLGYKLTGPESTALRVYAASFVFDLDVALDITNTGRSLIEIRPEELAVLDDRGTAFPVVSALGCKALAGKPVKLTAGATCSIRAELKLPPANPRNYRNLTVSLPHVHREGREFAITVHLVGTK